MHVIGLVLSIIVHYLFLRSLSAALVVGAGIPVTVLVTLVIMRILQMSFNLMTLGGIAAAIGMVIDDAIVVVEAIHAKLLSGQSAAKAIRSVTCGEVGPALVGSTLTPVVVFIPLAFLDGVAGVFFRALALTMVSALLTSLVVRPVTFTPALAAAFATSPCRGTAGRIDARRPSPAFGHWRIRMAGATCVAASLAADPGRHGVDRRGRHPVLWTAGNRFPPQVGRRGLRVGIYSRPGTSLSETNRMLRAMSRRS